MMLIRDMQRCAQELAGSGCRAALSLTADYLLHGHRAYLDDRTLVEASVIRAKLRAGVLPLMAWQGRQRHWPVDLWDCPVCGTGATEDAVHFLAACPAWESERVKLVSKVEDVCLLPGMESSVVQGWLGEWVSGGAQERVMLLLSSAISSSRQKVSPTQHAVNNVISLFLIRLWKLRKRYFGASCKV